MVKRGFPLLFCLPLLLSGCAQTPPQPSLTLADLQSELTAQETRLDERLQQQCETTLGQQTELLAQMNTRQQLLEDQLTLLENKLAKQQRAAVQQAAQQQCAPSSTQALDGKMLLGEAEWIWIEAVNRVFSARVDTGATTSSLSARDIVVFERDGKRWVRFNLVPEDNEEAFELEARLVRFVRIRQSSTDKLDRRPVVRLTVRVGGLTEDAQFTLTDRTQLTYPILLGREFLKDIAVVDVAREYVQPKPSVAPQPTGNGTAKGQ